MRVWDSFSIEGMDVRSRQALLSRFSMWVGLAQSRFNTAIKRN
jgi:hypothetical protein